MARKFYKFADEVRYRTRRGESLKDIMDEQVRLGREVKLPLSQKIALAVFVGWPLIAILIMWLIGAL
jgi:hypothetical protein